MKYYAIKRPDGSWVDRVVLGDSETEAWALADEIGEFPDDCYKKVLAVHKAEAAGYRCVEVDGFREVEK